MVVKQGTPSDEELEIIGFEIAEKWKPLGRRLKVREPELKGIDHVHVELSEKGYQLLLHWKQKEGCDATYQVLCEALSHELVKRQDLAQRFCYIDGNHSLFLIDLK